MKHALELLSDAAFARVCQSDTAEGDVDFLRFFGDWPLIDGAFLVSKLGHCRRL